MKGWKRLPNGVFSFMIDTKRNNLLIDFRDCLNSNWTQKSMSTLAYHSKNLVKRAKRFVISLIDIHNYTSRRCYGQFWVHGGPSNFEVIRRISFGLSLSSYLWASESLNSCNFRPYCKN